MEKEYLKYKNYAHFDKKMSVKKAKRILTNSDQIKKHGFFPFIHFTKKQKKIESINDKIHAKKEPKIRDIYYCAHLDRYIYQYYSHELGLTYNEYVKKHNIDECSAAYRIGKKMCNINYASDVFEFLKTKKNAIVIIGDFTKFFDNLDHSQLKKRIKEMKNSELDNEFYKIFKSVTNFKYINIEDLYEYFSKKNNKRCEKYYIRKLKVLMQMNEFKKFIHETNDAGIPYLKQNKNNYGIVQGSPLSGIFANIYMIHFDEHMNKLAQKFNGKYLRYSDDFVLVIDDVSQDEIVKIYEIIQKNVADTGHIQLENKKTNIYEFKNEEIHCINNLIFNTSQSPNVINFLGFSFNGKEIKIRDKTISKYFYKMNRSIKKYFEGKNKITRKKIYDKFSNQGEKSNFISYVKNAEKVFENEKSIANVRKQSKRKITENIGRIKTKRNK